MYIGAKPNVANYTMLDSITTSATTTFNLTKDGVAFFPENPLGVICSLNGVIQKAGSSFNIVNSTIVFASTLASTDVIDFILVMAQKIDLNTPADSSVTNAKTNFVSSSSSAGLQIKGDGTTDGTLQLNCSQNSHGIKLKSPPHSAGASYTLTFPTTDGNADEFLQTNGSGTLTWATAGGGGGTPYFLATRDSSVQDIGYTGVFTKLQFNGEIHDSDNAYDHTSNYRFTPQTAGKYAIFLNARIDSTSNGNTQPHLRSLLKKNGSTDIKQSVLRGSSSQRSWVCSLFVVVDLNGSSDYIEAYGYSDGVSSGSSQLAHGIASSSFGGYLIATSKV